MSILAYLYNDSGVVQVAHLYTMAGIHSWVLEVFRRESGHIKVAGQGMSQNPISIQCCTLLTLDHCRCNNTAHEESKRFRYT